MITGINSLSFLGMARSQSPLSQVAASVRVANNNTSPAQASALVTLGSQEDAFSAVYSMSPKKMSISATQISNPLLEGLMQSAMSRASVASFSELGAALLGNLEENPGNYTHALNRTEASHEMSANDKSAVTLNVVTQSGVTVKLTMTQTSDGVALEVNTEGGTLEQAETEAISHLGKAFEDALNGLGKKPPQLDIEGLTKFDSSVLKSVDLKTDMRRGNEVLQSLTFYADGNERRVSYGDGDFSLNVSSDISNPRLAGSYAQQQMALQSLDDRFDKARLDGHGDRAQMAAMKAVFRALHTTVNDDPAIAGPTAIRVGDSGKSRLSGLNDFSASLIQSDKFINPARADEKEGFSYQLSQTTSESSNNGVLSNVKQTMRSHLSASWYTPLDPSTPLSLNTLKSSQNYVYHQVEQEEESTTTLNYNSRGNLASVGHHEEANNLETVKKYVLGKLVDEVMTPEKYDRDSLVSLLFDEA